MFTGVVVGLGEPVRAGSATSLPRVGYVQHLELIAAVGPRVPREEAVVDA